MQGQGAGPTEHLQLLHRVAARLLGWDTWEPWPAPQDIITCCLVCTHTQRNKSKNELRD